jgi:hypothetical protein
MHQFGPELKSQSLEYPYTTSPRKKKFKTQPFTGKCMLTVFWNYGSIIHQEYMVRGTRINSRIFLKNL